MYKNVLLGVTASIAAYKACDLIRMFRKKGHSVKCVMTEDAKNFITPLTLETLSANKVTENMFTLPDKRSPAHISLSDEADIILIAPATADVIGKIANGICDDILTCTVCASTCKIVIAPAMNDNMFNNPVVQENIEKLKKYGYYFIEPVCGELACGRTGKGHLAPLEDIARKIEELLKDNS